MAKRRRRTKKVINRRNRNQGNSSKAIQLTNSAPPSVPAWFTDVVCHGLLIGGVGAIAGDVYMSWQGFGEMGISLWPATVLTGIVAISQVGCGVIQALGGSPRKGIGGNDDGDFVWGLLLPGLYFLDFASNFYGFGGTPHLFRILLNPMDAIGMVVANVMLALLLCFGDEILFRIRHQLSPAAEANRIKAQGRKIELDANHTALRVYRVRAIERAREIGDTAPIDLEWMDD